MRTLILKHYPKVVRQIREIQQIAKAEDIEFDKLKTDTTQTIENMFVHTANEKGVQVFEKILNITPLKTQTLDERKLNILSKINQGKVSIDQLESMISEYSSGARIIGNQKEFQIEIVTQTDDVDKNALYDIVDEILPLNIWFEISREISIRQKITAELMTTVYVNIGEEG